MVLEDSYHHMRWEGLGEGSYMKTQVGRCSERQISQPQKPLPTERSDSTEVADYTTARPLLKGNMQQLLGQDCMWWALPQNVTQLSL